MSAPAVPDASAGRAAPAAPPGPAVHDAEAAGRRVDEVLTRLAERSDPAAGEAAEELVRSLMEFYGAGLARILELLPPGGPADALLGDGLVAGLLVLHDLHPEDVTARIARALATVRDHELTPDGYDEANGTLRLRAAPRTGCGCSGGTDAARRAAEDALACFAPEVTTVLVRQDDDPREPVLLQIGTRG
ncbi:hypothetical protein [Streptomyces sp. NPDC047000]|uniref:hypothetical protein n=1 Tax=Streptomyces sp. NPDC047000 TaxID=3155474 RepID=UPI0033CB8EEA